MEGNKFFPDLCEWIDMGKKGNWEYCLKPRTNILEPELRVYCKEHYKQILEIRRKHDEQQS